MKASVLIVDCCFEFLGLMYTRSPGSSPGTAVPTGMKTAFVAVVADVSNMTSPLFHCTAMGLRGL